ncbi:MAG: hypothetical protein RLZZ58_714 [Pseudomonadota bacterium]|jgi:DNA-binding transcriptional LysR family regulator
MDRLQAMEMFLAVADTGSFVGAARALRVSPPAVTRGVAALEARLGAALFHRSTRAVTPTAEGAAFVMTARRILTELADAERHVAGSRRVPGGPLYITAPVVFGRLHVVPVVSGLIAVHDALDIRLMLIDRNVGIVEEGIDVAVRIGALADSSLLAIRIGSVRPVYAASPAYLAQYGVPADRSDLAAHRLIVSTGPRAASEWRIEGRQPAALKRRLTLNTVDAAIAAAEAGAGLANFLSYQVEDALAAGRLIEVLRPRDAEILPVSLVFDASRSRAASARAFVDAMRERAGQWGWGLRPS